MSYTSLNFLLFVCVTAFVYFLFPLKKYKWTVLLAASYIFYLFVGYKYAFYILFTTISTYGVARLVEKIARDAKAVLKEHKTEWSKEQKKEYKEKIRTKKRFAMLSAVVVNLGILAFLKYYNFFAGSLNGVFENFQLSFSAPTLRLILPLGISFYTFQSVGYVIDVYNEKVEAEKNIAKFALFVSFFPQIVQGPIGVYDHLAHQLYEDHGFEFTRVRHGCELILWGFFKKLIIADRVLIAINTVLLDYRAYNGTTLLFTVLLYAIQIYTDFSGGIDISRGVAQIFGIDMAENFRRPYFAKSINEYWRRWHITLGAWMKTYVFYPLAMSKRFLNASKKIKATRFGATSAGAHVAKVLPTSFASFIVFFLVGVWHGANWKYVFFGIWNGGIIMISILLEPLYEKWIKKLHIKTETRGFAFFQMARTFLIVLIGYVFDIAPNATDAFYTFKQILVNQNLIEGVKQISTLGLFIGNYIFVAICVIVLLIVSLKQEKLGNITMRESLDRKSWVLHYLVLLAGLLLVLTWGTYGPGYNPADFVYMQF